MKKAKIPERNLFIHYLTCEKLEEASIKQQDNETLSVTNSNFKSDGNFKCIE